MPPPKTRYATHSVERRWEPRFKRLLCLAESILRHLTDECFATSMEVLGLSAVNPDNLMLIYGVPPRNHTKKEIVEALQMLYDSAEDGKPPYVVLFDKGVWLPYASASSPGYVWDGTPPVDWEKHWRQRREDQDAREAKKKAKYEQRGKGKAPERTEADDPRWDGEEGGA